MFAVRITAYRIFSHMKSIAEHPEPLVFPSEMKARAALETFYAKAA